MESKTKMNNCRTTKRLDNMTTKNFNNGRKNTADTNPVIWNRMLAKRIQKYIVRMKRNGHKSTCYNYRMRWLLLVQCAIVVTFLSISKTEIHFYVSASGTSLHSVVSPIISSTPSLPIITEKTKEAIKEIDQQYTKQHKPWVSQATMSETKVTKETIRRRGTNDHTRNRSKGGFFKSSLRHYWNSNDDAFNSDLKTSFLPMPSSSYVSSSKKAVPTASSSSMQGNIRQINTRGGAATDAVSSSEARSESTASTFSHSNSSIITTSPHTVITNLNNTPPHPSANASTTTKSTAPSKANKSYPVSIYSIQGKRQYMEDEYFVNNQGTFASVMDGHGGRAVSRYVKQNLYARYLQARSRALAEAAAREKESGDERANKADHDVMLFHKTANARAEAFQETPIDPLQGNDEISTVMSSTASLRHQQSQEARHPSIEARISALKSAFETVDAEVQKISHWSFQGSTAVAVLFHKITTPSVHEGAITATSVSEIAADDTSPVSMTTMSTGTDTSKERTVILSANVGDSRAVLSRSGKAIQLTRDHKPNDPDERRRVEALGGKVVYCKPLLQRSTSANTDATAIRHKRRSTSSSRDADSASTRKATQNSTARASRGVYRINGNLSLSRAIGDRSEKPLVSSEVEIREIEMDEAKDEFIILGSDGVWDVFQSSQDLVDFVQSTLDAPISPLISMTAPSREDGNGNILAEDMNSMETITDLSREETMKKRRKYMAQLIVEEALRRGSMDNISAVVVWLRDE